MANQKQFRYPYSYDERVPCIHDRVLFIPSFYFEHQAFKMPEFHDEALFGNHNPVHVEFCSGNGEWIVAKALENPNINWIAVEIKFKRVCKIWSKMKNLGLKNLIIVLGDANVFAKHYLKDGVIQGIFINFPDPWPKDRHAKHRLIKSPFVEDMKRILQKEGEVCIVTDHAGYSLQVIEEMLRHFLSKHPSPYYKDKESEYGSSYFNRLWESKGIEIRQMQFVGV